MEEKNKEKATKNKIKLVKTKKKHRKEANEKKNN